MSQRDKVKMSDSEIRSFLQEGRTLQVATISKDGAPHLVAMWYVIIDGEIAFWTYAKSQKAINLERDPRLACLVETGQSYDELRGVQIRGRATLSQRDEDIQRIGQAIWERYNGPLNEQSQEAVKKMGLKRVVVFVKPVEIISWDHRKLGGKY